MKAKIFARISALLLLLLSAAPGLAAEVSLKADSLQYDPASRLIRAEGGVHLSRTDGELFGDRGHGDTDGKSFVLEGSVRGHFRTENAAFSCRYVKLTVGAQPSRRRIEASGDVVLTRGGDRLSSRTLAWESGGDRYRAEGRVLGDFTTHSVDADLVARDGERFWGKGVRRYEDRAQGLRLSAANLRGMVRADKVVEMEAFGNLTMEMPDSQGKTIRITGDTGVFSEARGTLVVSGNAVAIQEGRSVQAESLVLHLDTRRIEALGKPSLTFEIEE